MSGAGRVVVIGGGITGLTAAFTAARRGADVVVLEPGPVGGKLQTATFAGRPVDLAADAFLVRNPAAVELCRELGLDGELVHPAARNALVWSRGRLRPIPPNLMGVPLDLDPLAASGILSDGGLARVAHDLDGEAGPAPQDDSVGSLVRHHLGDEVVDRLVDPFVGGIYAALVDELSLHGAVPQLAAAARGVQAGGSLIRACRAVVERAPGPPGAPVFAAHPEGMGRIVAALRAELGDAVRASGARSVSRQTGSDGWVVECDGGPVSGEALILATPADDAARLVEGVSPGAARRLAAIPYAGVALVALAYREADVPVPLEASGFVVPRHVGMRLTACSWASSKWSHLAGGGSVVLRASVGHAGDPLPLGWDDGRLLARVRSELGHTMGIVAAPAEVRITRWPRSFPQYLPGHVERLDAIEAALAADAPGVFLAGAAYRGIGIPACVAQARDAAAAALARIDR